MVMEVKSAMMISEIPLIGGRLVYNIVQIFSRRVTRVLCDVYR